MGNRSFHLQLYRLKDLLWDTMCSEEASIPCWNMTKWAPQACWFTFWFYPEDWCAHLREALILENSRGTLQPEILPFLGRTNVDRVKPWWRLDPAASLQLIMPKTQFFSFWQLLPGWEACPPGHPKLPLQIFLLADAIRDYSIWGSLILGFQRASHGRQRGVNWAWIPSRETVLLPSAFIAGPHKALCKTMGWETSEGSAKSKRLWAQPNSYALCALNSS